jgi:Spy/CpxP family protein refolding chaperone
MNIRIQSVAAVAAITGFVGFAGAALAEPGHIHHGRHGDFTMAIAALKDKLDLNTSQQVMWDNAVAQSKSAREAARANFGVIKAALSAELAKPEPDLAAVAATSDEIQAANLALRQQVRNGWLTLYATFTPDQKAVVRDALQQRIARMESYREKKMKRMRGG